MAAEKVGAKKKTLPQQLKKTRDSLAAALRKIRARLVRHPLCNMRLHRWEMRGWGRCTRKRCDAYRSFGKVAGVKEKSR